MNRKDRRAAARNKSKGSNELKSFEMMDLLVNRSKETWDKLIAADEEFAINMMELLYDYMDGEEKLELLNNSSKSMFYGVFGGKVVNEIESGTFEEAKDKLWLYRLSLLANYALVFKSIGNNLTAVYLKLSAAGAYSPEAIKSTDYMRFTGTACASNGLNDENVHKWLAENIDDQWLIDDRFDQYDAILNDPAEAGFFSASGRVCMDKLKARWQYLKLTERHQNALKAVAPNIVAL